MKTMNKFIRQGMEDELAYCKKMVEAGHKNPHWAIRVLELTKDLSVKKRKAKK